LVGRSVSQPATLNEILPGVRHKTKYLRGNRENTARFTTIVLKCKYLLQKKYANRLKSKGEQRVEIKILLLALTVSIDKN